jgi:hypothetical protein
MEPNSNTPPQKPKDKFPSGFENLPLEQKQNWTNPDLVKFALAALEQLMPYRGERADVRDQSFSVLTNDEKIEIYNASLAAMNKMSSDENLKTKLENKLITLVGTPGVSFENNELKIGPKATKEDILKFIDENFEPPQEQVSETSEMEGQEFKIEQIDQELLDKLNKAGIKIENVKVSVNLATYDENEKTLKIRQDANAEHVNQYIRDVVFKEQDVTGEPSPDAETFKEQNFNYNERDTSKNVIYGEIEKAPDEPNFDYEKKDKNLLYADGKEDAIVVDEPQWQRPEARDPQSKWSELNDLLMGLGIDLKTNEEHLAKFQEKNPDGLEQKSDEIREVIESFPDKNALKEKISTIRLGYPKYEGDSKIFIEDEILYLDLGISKQEMIDFLNENIPLTPAAPENLPEPTQSEQTVTPVTPEPTPAVPSPELVVPEPVPAQTPVTPEPVVSQVEKSPIDEWEEFVKLRNDLAKTEAKKGNFSIDSGLSIENLKSKYVSDKERIAGLVRKQEHERLGLGEGPLTREQEMSLNDYLFEELVKKENDAYLEALKANRKETWKDKTVEATKNLLGTKTVQWYLGLSKKQRMALNFGVGGLVGLAAGGAATMGVASYLGWRAARVGLSGTAGTAAGEWANKKWSAEDLKKAEEKEKEDLKNADIPLEEKSKGLLDIEKRYKKERIKMTLKKMGTTVAAGAGTGFLTGLAEHAFMGAGGATRSALESKGGKSPTIVENKLPPRKGFEPSGNKNPGYLDQTASKITRPKLEPLHAPKPPAPPTQEELNAINAKIYAENAPKIIFDPSILKHEVVAGDSRWNILDKILDNNEQFKGMTEAQKTYVLSVLTNKTLQNPADYGLGDEEFLHVGDKTDFTKLFENSKEVKSIFDKAKDTIAPGSAQEHSILANKVKISAWVKENPHVKLNTDKVEEILSGKPKAESVIEGAKSRTVEPIPSDIQDTLNPEPRHVEPVPSHMQDTLRPERSPIPPPPEVPDIHSIDEPAVEYPNHVAFAGGTAMAGVAVMSALDREQTHRDIAEAKKRLAELEGGGSNMPKNADKVIPINAGMRTLSSDAEFARSVDEAFRVEINNIYGKSGFMGMGKIAGVDTKEWGEMARLPASKIVEYYTGDSTKSGLSADIIKKLSKSKSHEAIMRQTAGLMEQSNGAVKPFENENMEQFIKRLGGYVLRTHLKKAA